MKINPLFVNYNTNNLNNKKENKTSTIVSPRVVSFAQSSDFIKNYAQILINKNSSISTNKTTKIAPTKSMAKAMTTLKKTSLIFAKLACETLHFCA